jgi:hypothetical protein
LLCPPDHQVPPAHVTERSTCDLVERGEDGAYRDEFYYDATKFQQLGVTYPTIRPVP